MTMTSEKFYGKQYHGHTIREQDDYDLLPDPRDMSYVEAQICNNISNCGNEIDMIDGTIRLLVQHMLLHWGLACDQTKISIQINVDDVEEAITWIDHDRVPVNFANIHEHIIGMNAACHATPDVPFRIKFGRGGAMGNKFDLTIRERDYDND